MVRMCLGSLLPGGTPGSVYLLRNVQGGASAGYEQWDVTNPKAPVMLKSLTGIRSTHKDWWECTTGIAYMPGSKNPVRISGTPLWRQSQAMLIYDWSNPEQWTASDVHPHVRTAGRRAERDGTGAELAPWRDLHARASAGGPTAARARPTTSSATASTRHGVSATTAS